MGVFGAAAAELRRAPRASERLRWRCGVRGRGLSPGQVQGGRAGRRHRAGRDGTCHCAVARQELQWQRGGEEREEQEPRRGRHLDHLVDLTLHREPQVLGPAERRLAEQAAARHEVEAQHLEVGNFDDAVRAPVERRRLPLTPQPVLPRLRALVAAQRAGHVPEGREDVDAAVEPLPPHLRLCEVVEPQLPLVPVRLFVLDLGVLMPEVFDRLLDDVVHDADLLDVHDRGREEEHVRVLEQGLRPAQLDKLHQHGRREGDKAQNGELAKHLLEQSAGDASIEHVDLEPLDHLLVADCDEDEQHEQPRQRVLAEVLVKRKDGLLLLRLLLCALRSVFSTVLGAVLSTVLNRLTSTVARSRSTMLTHFRTVLRSSTLVGKRTGGQSQREGNA